MTSSFWDAVGFLIVALPLLGAPLFIVIYALGVALTRGIDLNFTPEATVGQPLATSDAAGARIHTFRTPESRDRLYGNDHAA